MYKLTETANVDIDAELAAITAHIADTWAPIENLGQIVKYVQEQAFIRGRAWIEKHPVWLSLSAAEAAREARLTAALTSDEEQRLGPYYDAPCMLLRYMSLQTDALREAGLNLDGRWDYEKVVNAIHREARTQYLQLDSAKPLLWDALAKNYIDFDGMEDFDHKAATASFNGADTSTAGAGDFVTRTALPHVMYDETCQGRKAASVLVGAVFAHFLGIVAHRNTQGMLEAIRKFSLDTLPASVTFGTRFASANPLLQALITMAESSIDHREQALTNVDAYTKALADARVFAVLPESEKEAIRERNRADIDEMLASMRVEDPDASRRQEAEAERYRGILLTLMPKPQ